MKTEVRLELDRRAVFAEGRPFGEAGPYERLSGRVRFALDPADAHNANTVDLDYAPRNGGGLVEFSGDIDILKPVDLARGSQRVLYDVNNRGNRTALGSLNDAPRSTDPLSVADAGNGFLMRQGHTVVWSGWQGDLVPGAGLARCRPAGGPAGRATAVRRRPAGVHRRRGLASSACRSAGPRSSAATR